MDSDALLTETVATAQDHGVFQVLNAHGACGLLLQLYGWRRWGHEGSVLGVFCNRKGSLAPDPSPAAYFLNQQGFSPLNNILEARIWLQDGIERFANWDIKPLDKSEFSKGLGVQIPRYKYLQLQHLLYSPTLATVMTRPKTPFELLLLNKDNNDRGVLSIIYKTLTEAYSTQSTTYQKLWGKDVICLGAETWNALWAAFPFRTTATAIQWQSVKFVFWWHYTPAKFKNISSDIFPREWKAYVPKAAQLKQITYTTGGHVK